jgi:hypothetical protein
MKLSKWFFATIIGLFSASAFGWGSFGHRVVGAVAQNHLCKNAEIFVADILDGATLAEVATWADEMRSQPKYDYMKPWHFVDIDKGQTYKDIQAPIDGNLVTALAAQQTILNDPASTKDEKQQALKLIVHFVGDAHQPMHSGYKLDHGGNSIAIDWFGEITNLHSVWDSGLLEKTNLSFTEIAKLIDRSGQPGWNVQQLNPENWVDESSFYNIKIEDEVVALKNGGNRFIPLKLTDDYFNQNIPLARQRLLESGLRLANLLNQNFGCP